MSEMNWKPCDWAVFDRDIVQIKAMRDEVVTVSDGSIETHGQLLAQLRPLTLRNKRTAEYFDYYYRELNKIRGECGFNYPDISIHFSQLALNAMDGDEKDKVPFDAASDFVRKAREYVPIIQGVNLFR